MGCQQCNFLQKKYDLEYSNSERNQLSQYTEESSSRSQTSEDSSANKNSYSTQKKTSFRPIIRNHTNLFVHGKSDKAVYDLVKEVTEVDSLRESQASSKRSQNQVVVNESQAPPLDHENSSSNINLFNSRHAKAVSDTSQQHQSQEVGKIESEDKSLSQKLSMHSPYIGQHISFGQHQSSKEQTINSKDATKPNFPHKSSHGKSKKRSKSKKGKAQLDQSKNTDSYVLPHDKTVINPENILDNKNQSTQNADQSQPVSTKSQKVDHINSALLKQSVPKDPQSQVLKLGNSNFVAQKKGKVANDYQILEVLGKGAFGEVKKVVHKITGDIRAMKIIKKDLVDEEYLTTLNNEIKILKQLDHPNTVKLYEVYSDKSNVYLITEYLEGGELFNLILKSKQFNESIAAKIMKQLLSVVAYCHQRNIVHRDLKPENLLLVKPNAFEIKVIDFGLSRTFDPTKNLYQRMGTAYYIAPEVLKNKYNEKCDVWSCGVILYILLSGTPPFNGKSDQQIFDSISLGFINFHGVEWKNVSNDAKIFIKKLLQVQPDQRISAQQALDDPWLKIYTSSDVVAPPMAMNILNNLRSFNSEMKFQQAVLSYLANQLSSKDERSQLTEIFKNFDLNHDGVLCKDELIEGYKKLYGSKQRAKMEVEQILVKVDLNGNGKIDYSEFLAANMETKELLTNDKLQAAFNLFDIDQNGMITLEEIKSLLGEGLMDQNSQLWKSIIGEADANDDGEISFQEFKIMMKKLLEKK